ncbi:MAG: 50S ribosomal protein L22 [bacterium]
MEAKAHARYIRIAPRKVRLVADMIRGKKVEDALDYLHFTNKKATKPIGKLLHSAVSNFMNSENAPNVDPENLIIRSIWVDEGPTMRRYRPRAMGRASIIRKRLCHISIILSDGLK